MLGGELEKAGRLAAPLLLPDSDWVHRRVQRVAYRSPDLMVNRLSVDFTVPRGLGSWVPVSVLPKWPPVYRLDFKRSDGTSIPLLTSRENGIADKALMTALAEMVSPRSLEDKEFASALSKLCCGPETDLADNFEVFRDHLQDSEEDPKVERLLDLGALLVDATLLWYPVGVNETEVRRICKLEYLIRSTDNESIWRRLARSLSWQFPADWIPLYHIGADANFHLDIESPSVLRLTSLQTNYLWLNDDLSPVADEPARAPDMVERVRAAADEAALPNLVGAEQTAAADAAQPAGGADFEDEDEGEADARAEALGIRPEEFIDNEGGLAHVYVSGRRPLGAFLTMTLVPVAGVVGTMAIAALLIAALATGFYAWRSEVDLPANTDAAVSVLILIPALIGYIVVRPTDPPLTRRFLLGVQVLALAAGAVPLVMAVLLLRYGSDPDSLRDAWFVPLIASWVFAICLAISWMRATWVGGPWRDDNREGAS